MLTPELIVEAIDTDYQRVREEESSHGRNPVRGSGLGDCPRSIRVRLSSPDLDNAKIFSGRQLRIFEMGHQREEGILNRLAWGLLAKDKTWDVRRQLKVEIPLESIEPFEAGQIFAKIHTRYPDQKQLVVNSKAQLCVATTCDLVLKKEGTTDVYNIDAKTKAGYGFKKLGDEGNGYGYRVQIAAQNRGLRNLGYEVAGSWALYESKDNCELLPLGLEKEADYELDQRLLRIHEILTNWNEEMDLELIPAVYADPARWNKPYHVKAAGCLPWQCNYCAVGPVAGKCVNAPLTNIAKAGADIPKWEIG